MIIKEKIKDLIVVGEDISKTATISGNKLAKLQYLLTKGLYKDPITAVIAEWTNNGIDSVVQAGKDPVKSPVIVSIFENKNGQYTFSVEDKGMGLDDRDFEDICMNYLESTKENDNDTIGHFGIGMKSFLSLDRSATFICIKNGIRRKYLVYEGDEFVNYSLIEEIPTTEENGVKAEIQINGWSERTLFINKAKQKLAYYDTVALIIDNDLLVNDIFRNKDFQYSTLNKNNSLHLCLKDVYYSIDWEALGIKSIEMPFALRIDLKDGLTPTPSRESYITNDKTKKLLLDKITQMADWMVNKYNSKVKEFPTFKDAYDYLGITNYYITINKTDTKQIINPILKYSQIKILSPKVKGICHVDPYEYKEERDHFFDGYDIVAYMSNNHLKNKTIRLSVSFTGHIFLSKYRVILINSDFLGNIRTYCREKYGNDTLYVRKTNFKRIIGTKDDIQGHKCYNSILNLHLRIGDKKDYINEWDFVEKSITDDFIDETKIATSKEYLKWLEDKKEKQKINRLANKVAGIKVGMNKQLGDVTIAYAYERYDKIHFKKKPYPIEDLTKRKELTILLTEDDDLETIKVIIKMNANNNIKFALIGKNEIKKIPNHHQFINYKQYMSMKCKSFMRLASAILFKKTLNELDKIYSYRNGIFANFAQTLNKDKILLENYVSRNLEYLDDKVAGMIVDVALEKNLFDLSLWDVHKRLKDNLNKYDFINLFKEPPSYDIDTNKRYMKVVNQLLLFRKKYYNDLPEGTEIVFTKN